MEKTLYHGSDKEISDMGMKQGDFGPGLYLTFDPLTARERAVESGHDGHVSECSIDMDGLDVLDLTSPEHSILEWLTILIENRTFRIDGDIALDSMEYMKENFRTAQRKSDVIIGWRADDSHFSIATGFLNNGLSLRQLRLSLREEDRVVLIRSGRAYERLKTGSSVKAERKSCFEEGLMRDASLRNLIRVKREKDDIYVRDIIDGEVGRDDPRLQ